MEWYQVLSIVAANFAAFLWLRSEANADRRDLSRIILDVQKEMRDEMKDFHGRICAIEEGRKKS